MANCIRNGSHYRRHRYKPGEINCAGCGEARPLVDVAKERLARLEDRGELGQAIAIGVDREVDVATHTV